MTENKPSGEASLFEVNAGLIYAAHMFTSNDASRYYLHGVYIEPSAQGGVTITGTDGSSVITIHDKNGKAQRPLILRVRKYDLKRIKPKAKHPSTNLVAQKSLENGMMLAHIVYDSLRPMKSVLVEEVKGTYPDYRRVFAYRAEIGTTYEAPFDPERAHAFGKAGKYIARAIGLRDLSDQHYMFTNITIRHGKSRKGDCPPMHVLSVNYIPQIPAYGVLAGTRGEYAKGEPEWFAKERAGQEADHAE